MHSNKKCDQSVFLDPVVYGSLPAVKLANNKHNSCKNQTSTGNSVRNVLGVTRNMNIFMMAASAMAFVSHL